MLLFYLYIILMKVPLKKIKLPSYFILVALGSDFIAENCKSVASSLTCPLKKGFI